MKVTVRQNNKETAFVQGFSEERKYSDIRKRFLQNVVHCLFMRPRVLLILSQIFIKLMQQGLAPIEKILIQKSEIYIVTIHGYDANCERQPLNKHFVCHNERKKHTIIS